MTPSYDAVLPVTRLPRTRRVRPQAGLRYRAAAIGVDLVTAVPSDQPFKGVAVDLEREKLPEARREV